VPKNAMKTAKKTASTQDKALNLLEMPVTPSPIMPYKPIKVTNTKAAKRLLGRIILCFQKNEIADAQAKTLSYLLSVYCEIGYKQDLEDRVKNLEEKV